MNYKVVCKGYIEKIRYRNEVNGYTVFDISCQDDNDDITCVGNFPFINEGEHVKLGGEYVDHATYGLQLSVKSMEVIKDDDEISIVRYLGSGAIKGVGPVMAKRIVDKFGADTLRIMQDEPERLAEIKGISMRKAEEIYLQYYEKKELRDAVIFMQQYNISNRLAVKIYNEYKDEVYNIIRTNPYRLASDIKGVGFRIADEIGRSVGIDPNSEFRKKCAVTYILNQAGANGHTYLPEEELIRNVMELLMINCDDIMKLLSDMSAAGGIICVTEENEKRYYPPYMYYMELNCARMLLDLNCIFRISDTEIESRIKRIEKNKNIRLADMQRMAVREATKSGVLVITGGPGTGKTTTIDAIISAYEAFGFDILLAAPTGRAARRMSETTGYEAQTIHRLLEINGSMDDDEDSVRFERNESYPLEADAVIIDEMSMVDLPLFNALLKAVVTGTRLIMVGDANQLPSVGPGNVLKDIIDSGCFNVVSLNEIFRQARGSDIVMNAHRINAGEEIAIDNKSRDFFMLRRDDPKVIISVILQLMMKNLPPYVGSGITDIQVLCPMKKGELGVDNLNIVLQKYINPASDDKAEAEYGDRIFREGDKVMQIKNNYQLTWERRGYHGVVVEEGCGIFNGDCGIIRFINTVTNEITVEYEDNKYVVYPHSIFDELELAYAITVHKSQGSEYPAVILPILYGTSLLLHRNLLYTAVTRAKKCVTIVGLPETVNRMIHNERQQKRYSALKKRLRDLKQNGGIHNKELDSDSTLSSQMPCVWEDYRRL